MNSFHPINKLSSLIILSAAFSMAGCESGPKVRSDYDPGANFGSYTTYNFVKNAGPDYGNVQSFFTKYVIEAVTLEMESRGYTKSNTPDLLINFNAILNDKVNVTTTSAPMGGGYYGYRGRGGYGAWGGYGYATETHVSEYTEGTFNIDIIDSKRLQLVWEAVGVGRVTDKKLKDVQTTVRNAVPVYFAKYPFVAGSGTPVPTK